MALPNSKILIHQVSGGFPGQATDIEIHAKEIIDVRRRLDEIIAKHTSQEFEKVTHDTERDYFMSAEEAKEYNIVDRVIEHTDASQRRSSRRLVGTSSPFPPSAAGFRSSGIGKPKKAFFDRGAVRIRYRFAHRLPGRDPDRQGGRAGEWCAASSSAADPGRTHVSLARAHRPGRPAEDGRYRI